LIEQNFEKLGDAPIGGFCARNVTNALDGVHTFSALGSFWLPSSLFETLLDQNQWFKLEVYYGSKK